MLRIVFVCLGNICRSPLAEAVMNKKVGDAGIADKIAVDSAGTGSWHIGELPDGRTLDCISRNGLELDHRAQQFDQSYFDKYDYIVAMDKSNLRDIMSLATSDHSQQVLLMRDFDPVDKGSDVPDPYYGGSEGFQHVHDILDRSMDNLLDHIRSRHADLG